MTRVVLLQHACAGPGPAVRRSPAQVARGSTSCATGGGRRCGPGGTAGSAWRESPGSESRNLHALQTNLCAQPVPVAGYSRRVKIDARPSEPSQLRRSERPPARRDRERPSRQFRDPCRPRSSRAAGHQRRCRMRLVVSRAALRPDTSVLDRAIKIVRLRLDVLADVICGLKVVQCPLEGRARAGSLLVVLSGIDFGNGDRRPVDFVERPV